MYDAATRNADTSVTGATDKWGNVLHGFGERLDEMRGGAISKAREAMHTADGTMHRHPYPVMAALALTGLIVGILVARR
ncbi:Membrane-anchored ribosome-binding protein, inhibits growth in stationary phase, ElaB/YqjD/DUF883 family [Variovorax sp. HW608]|uniref:hypothetical protein n=1 Tax=Variovorax sp. HW608 TaxID=1034889 RepID=UPI00081FD2DF|nr:hypothetical protein [Variovorax sp. HW608]SCK27898.1 Membrane-anchored ribosome-binding protein, inhibits growth in stationary phase, ElaB/YqjD/DUF883 family [Variovorax sp. HW608]